LKVLEEYDLMKIKKFL